MIVTTTNTVEGYRITRYLSPIASNTVWFDNIFSDWSVLDRITRATERTQRAINAVATAAQHLQQRKFELVALERTLSQARERLILDR